MIQKQKDLLLKDLCSRLPYGVKVESIFINPDTKEHKSCGVEVFDATSLLMLRDKLGEFKPYLFPMSSMTEEQSKIYHELVGGMFGTGVLINLDCLIDFFNRNHLDWKGLIPLGLAEDATDKNIY
jgi:hypothetical protein